MSTSETIRTKVVRAVRGMGRIEAIGDMSAERPTTVRILQGPKALFGDGACLKVWQGVHQVELDVLRLEVSMGRYEPYNFDHEYFQQWITAFLDSAPLGLPLLREVDTTDGVLWEVAVAHTVAVDDLTAEALSGVLEGMMLTWRACTRPVTQATRRAARHNAEQRRQRDRTQAVLTELDALVGLAPVKNTVRQLVAQQKVAALRNQKGLKAYTVSPHLVFTGNPGTGKTTVARLVGRLYRSLGLLEKGHVVEVERSSLVAPYLGQTALKATEQFEKALGGVLFIDEAYSLAVDGRDYGREVIEALLTFMEAHRGEVAVVVAGYPDDMQRFLDSNPGLRSRFDLTLTFPDLTDDELFRVFTDLLMAHDYRLDQEAIPYLKRAIAGMPRGRAFGNAREVHRLFNRVVCHHASAVASVESPTPDQLQGLGITDIVGSAPHIAKAQPAVAKTYRTLVPGYL